MNKAQKKELRQRQNTRQLMGISQLTEHGGRTAGGELVFFMIKPDNLSVLSAEGIRGRVKNLTDLLRGTQEVRLLALDSRESFQRNKDWYRQRLEIEELPALRELLRQDAAHLDAIQASTASAREFALVYRLAPQEAGADGHGPAADGAGPAGPGLSRPAGGGAGHQAYSGGVLSAGCDHGMVRGV